MSSQQVSSFLIVSPEILEFQFNLKKQSYCSMQLTNKTHQYVAFQVKTTNPKGYCMRPNAGVVSPGATCHVEVIMQAAKESPPDLQCKDKFLVQSVVVPEGTTAEDTTREMFDKVVRNVGEFTLRVTYLSVHPFSPIPEATAAVSSSDPNNMYVTASTPPAKVQSPIRSIFNLKDKKLMKEIDKVEDCYMLGFDPYESFDLSSLSNRLDRLKLAPDVVVVAERGQVACRDYPHPRHLCAVHPFNTSPHKIHCKMCYCYICDKPAPCKKWAKDAPNMSYVMHCDASEDIQFWRKLKEDKKMRKAIKQ